MIKASDFGEDFQWGIATAAAQIEGAANDYGRGDSIWDTFSKRKGKVKLGHQPDVACDFYHRYKSDLALVTTLGFKIFRFSISWSRVLPYGRGEINQEGIRFYHDLIDECIALGITPYITLYHWDLPEALSKEGGWTSFSINADFNAFVLLCAQTYGDKVKNWIVINEPFGFTSLGYMLGIHAPGETGLQQFFPAVLHTAIAQADGARIIRAEVQNANIGTAFSCSKIIPYTETANDLLTANRVDCLMNRLFLEPTLGLGFPDANWEVLEKFAISYSTWRYKERMTFDFDFIGLQNYFPLVVKFNAFIPIIQAWEVKAKSRKVPHTGMGWEINADSFYSIIKQFSEYPNLKNIIITENGAAFNDHLINGEVNDDNRIAYFQSYLSALLKAKEEGLKVSGYMAWTLMDNFEWAEGYKARFGLIHTDFHTQERIIKKSGLWWKDFLSR
ncbi:MAG: beta-glucosidase [Pedobacter sp.]|nr:MAG: beta-glucosidase [Pedobacter sp.]